MSTKYNPKRYYMYFDEHDPVTDAVCGSDGNDRVATMKGWYWDTLDWINMNTPTSAEMLVDVTIAGRGKHSFSEGLQVAIWNYIDAYVLGIQEDLRKGQSGSA